MPGRKKKSTPIPIDPLTGLKQTNEQRQLLTGAHTKLQSEVFNISRTVNPLTAAAGPLLTLATELRKLEQQPDYKKLHQQLSHEIKAFESKALSLGYRAQVVLAARYLLCTLIDENLQDNKHWGEEQDEEQPATMLKTFQGEEDGSERVIFILERSAEDPTVYLDLVELGYLCLSLGMQGKFRHMDNGYYELNIFMDNLFQLIAHHRGDTSKQLKIGAASSEQTSEKEAEFRLPPIWTTIVVTLLLLIGIYIPYHHHLETVASPVAHQIKVIQDETN